MLLIVFKQKLFCMNHKCYCIKMRFCWTKQRVGPGRHVAPRGAPSPHAAPSAYRTLIDTLKNVTKHKSVYYILLHIFAEIILFS